MNEKSERERKTQIWDQERDLTAENLGTDSNKLERIRWE